MPPPAIEVSPGLSVAKAPNQQGRYSHRLIADLGGQFLGLSLGACAFLSMLASFAISPFSGSLMHLSLEGKEYAEHVEWLPACLVYMVAFLVACQVFGLLDMLQQRNLVSQLARSTVAAALALVGTLIFFHLALYETLGRFISLNAWVLTWCSTTILFWIFWNLSLHLKPRIGLIGNAEFTEPATEFLNAQQRPMELIPLIIREGEPGTDPDSIRIAHEIRTLKRWTSDLGIDEVVYQAAAVDKMDELVLTGISEGVRFTSFSDFVEKYFARTVPAQIPQSWLLSGFFGKVRPIYELNKRIVDILISVSGLILVSPVLVVLFLLMKLVDPGPFFYSQTRVGRYGKNFQIYKIRSMRVDSEKEGAQWARKNDSRVTAIGRLIRTSRFDEVPQFWNILKGDMSFIGPRPERPEFVESLNRQIPHYQFRHLVKPGLTGWAQVNYPYGASVRDSEEKLAFDLYYIKYTSLFLDLQIFFKTLGAVMKGAR